MRTRLLLVLVMVLAMSAPMASAASAGPAAPSNLSAIVEGNNRFALDLYGKLRETPGNLFFSPHSISAALAMTYAGARGQTAEEMARVLHFPEEKAGLHSAFRALQDGLNAAAADSVELNVANRLWGQEGVTFLQPFLDTTRVEYGAELGHVDFAHQSDAARQEINAWVAGQTKDRIRDLLAPGVLNDLTRLVLANAIYFRGKWSSPFNPKATMQDVFHLTPSDTIHVRMMNAGGHRQYGAWPGLSALKLDYRGHRLSAVFLLPDRVDGLAALEDSLRADKLREWLSGLNDEEVIIRIPRFTMTSEFSLRDQLSEMGMPGAFHSGANFSGMTRYFDLWISAVIHKAFVELAEEGTEAAAATAVVTTLGISKDQYDHRRPVRFIADHPFLFLIRDNPTGSILFMGRVMNPRG